MAFFTRRREGRVEDERPDLLTWREQRTRAMARLARNVARVAFVIIGVLTVLEISVTIGPLLASVGALGLAISFGARTLQRDVISGTARS